MDFVYIYHSYNEITFRFVIILLGNLNFVYDHADYNLCRLLLGVAGEECVHHSLLL